VGDLRTGGLGTYDLRDRVAVVTGGSSGIGAAVARRLAGAGARVVVGYDHGEERAAAVVAGLSGTGHRSVRLSVLDSAGLGQAATEVAAVEGRCDVLVNSAGTTRPVPHADLDALDDETFDRVLVTNVRGTFAVIRAFVPLLRASGDGIVVTLSSVAGITGTGSSIAYAASKAAQDTMTRSLARVLGPEVRLVNVSPAAVDTAFVEGRDRAAIERQAASTPLQVVADPDDVAVSVLGVITHLRLTTGVVVLTDGGNHLR